MSDQDQIASLSVLIDHTPFFGEPFNPIFKLSWYNQSEELDHRETLGWFKTHGATNLEAVNSALNQASNFGSSAYVIKRPVFPKGPVNSSAPRI